MREHRNDTTDLPNRRDFLQLAGSAAGGAWLALHLPAIQQAALYAHEVAGTDQAFETLSAGEARVLRTIAARCYPTDATPGAEEAGVIYFMDRALGTFWARFHGMVQEGVTALEAKVAADHPGAEDFASLSTEEQDALLAWMETDQAAAAFLIQMLVACGMFADPGYGGNRDKVGWRIIGFDDRHVWEPPFGYYDREYAGSGEGDR